MTSRCAYYVHMKGTKESAYVVYAVHSTSPPLNVCSRLHTCIHECIRYLRTCSLHWRWLFAAFYLSFAGEAYGVCFSTGVDLWPRLRCDQLLFRSGFCGVHPQCGLQPTSSIRDIPQPGMLTYIMYTAAVVSVLGNEIYSHLRMYSGMWGHVGACAFLQERSDGG